MDRVRNQNTVIRGQYQLIITLAELNVQYIEC